MFVAVDTGGTKTLITSFDRKGTARTAIKFPTPRDTTEYVDLVRTTLQEHFRTSQVEAVVVALPGIVKDGVALWCNNLGWKDFDAASALKGVLGNDVPVLIENDANLAGLGEVRSCKPMPASALYVTISTGIGTGIIENGRIDEATKLSEGGHSLVEYDGKVRPWESFASGRAIVGIYGKYASEITSKRTWKQISDRISRGFLAIIPVLQPDTIIIGGSIGTYYEQYGDTLVAILEQKLPPHIPCPAFQQAQHPEEAVVYGCYYYAVDYLAGR